MIKKYNIIEECYQKAQHYINLASNSLVIFKDSKEKDILKNLTSFSLVEIFKDLIKILSNYHFYHCIF
jgi:octaprenyl-diphosphate synthase